MPYRLDIPDYGSLSIEQRRAVGHQGCNLRLKGGPGTGKSLVSLWRALDDTSGSKVLILVYTLSLEFYFKEMIRSARQRGASKPIDLQRSKLSYHRKESLLNDYWDEIILDEAQDMEEKHIVLFRARAKCFTYGADYRQSLYRDKAISEERLVSLLPPTLEVLLNRNYRSTRQILLAVRAFFPDRAISPEALSRSRPGPLVRMRIVERYSILEEIKSVLREVIERQSGNIAILVPSENKVDDVFDAVEDIKNGDTTKYSSRLNIDSIEEMGQVHVCSYKSSKGLEWDTVILPYFGARKWFIEKTSIGLNDHYVAMTRAKGELWLFSEHPKDNNTLDSAYGQESTDIVRSKERHSQLPFPSEKDDLPF